MPNVTLPLWLQIGVASIQALFFVSTGATAIASFRLARRTLLQPARTEVFKGQLEDLRRVLKEFVGKDEHALWVDCGLEEVEDVNYTRFIDDYAEKALGVDVPRKTRPYARDRCPASWIKANRLKSLDQPVALSEPEAKAAGRAEYDEREWVAYTYDETHLPVSFLEFRDRVRSLMSEPLLPSQCVNLLGDYSATVFGNMAKVSEVIDATVQEMPQMYPDRETLAKAHLGWLHNRYLNIRTPLKPKAEATIEFARSYFDADGVYNASSSKGLRVMAWRSKSS